MLADNQKHPISRHNKVELGEDIKIEIFYRIEMVCLWNINQGELFISDETCGNTKLSLFCVRSDRDIAMGLFGSFGCW